MRAYGALQAFSCCRWPSFRRHVRAEMPAQMAGKPEDVGLSSAQLKRLEAATKKNIDDGLMPGAVMLVARRGKVAWVSVQGKRAADADDPMKFDSIFRIYSMTKPITSLVLMQLVEEGRLQVYDPVAKYLPEIGKMKVGTEVTVDGRPATAPQRSRAGDDGAGPAAPHRRPDLRQPRDVAGPQGLHRRQDRRSHGDQRGDGEAAGRRAAAVHAGRALGIQRRGRRPGPADRGADRQDADGGLQRARVRPARHGRYRFPGAGRQARARGAARPEAQRPADDATLQGRRRRQVRVSAAAAF